MTITHLVIIIIVRFLRIDTGASFVYTVYCLSYRIFNDIYTYKFHVVIFYVNCFYVGSSVLSAWITDMWSVLWKSCMVKTYTMQLVALSLVSLHSVIVKFQLISAIVLRIRCCYKSL